VNKISDGRRARGKVVERENWEESKSKAGNAKRNDSEQATKIVIIIIIIATALMDQHGPTCPTYTSTSTNYNLRK